MKTAPAIYRWTAKGSSKCLGRYHSARTLLEAVQAGRELVKREFDNQGSVPIETSLDEGKAWCIAREDTRGRHTSMRSGQRNLSTGKHSSPGRETMLGRG